MDKNPLVSVPLDVLDQLLDSADWKRVTAYECSLCGAHNTSTAAQHGRDCPLRIVQEAIDKALDKGV